MSKTFLMVDMFLLFALLLGWGYWEIRKTDKLRRDEEEDRRFAEELKATKTEPEDGS